MTMIVCLSVWQSVRSHISKTTWPNFIKLSCMLLKALAQSSLGGVEKHYVLPVFWITSCCNLMPHGASCVFLKGRSHQQFVEATCRKQQHLSTRRRSTSCLQQSTAPFARLLDLLPTIEHIQFLSTCCQNGKNSSTCCFNLLPVSTGSFDMLCRFVISDMLMVWTGLRVATIYFPRQIAGVNGPQAAIEYDKHNSGDSNQILLSEKVAHPRRSLPSTTVLLMNEDFHRSIDDYRTYTSVWERWRIRRRNCGCLIVMKLILICINISQYIAY